MGISMFKIMLHSLSEKSFYYFKISENTNFWGDKQTWFFYSAKLDFIFTAWLNVKKQ